MSETAEKIIDGEAERIGEPAAEVKAELRSARELIPVGPRGATLMNVAQQVDFAQQMAKAVHSVPEFLRGNIGDCLAIVDIASRADLSPYMLAMKTYLEPKSKKLCFESQAYHALAMPWLKGDFEIAYEGEDEETICVIAAYLKSDPTKRREHRSEPLGKARPKRNDEGAIKGSPLWDKKPRVQLAYDTMRDWVRLYAPRATLGIYTPDEIEQYSIRNVTPQPRIAARNSALPRGSEGHQGERHIESELAQIAPGRAEVIKAAEEPAKPDKPHVSRETTPGTDPEAAGGSAQDAAQQAPNDPPNDGTSAAAPKPQEASQDAQAAPPAAGEAKPDAPEQAASKPAEPVGNTPKTVEKPAKSAEEPAKTVENEPKKPKRPDEAENPKEYEDLWLPLIEAATSPKLKDDWKRERAVRERLGVPADAIERLRGKVEAKVAKLLSIGA